MITADILFDLLKETYTIHRYGSGLAEHPLHLPVFYDERKPPEADRVYIMRTQNLPSSPNQECLYICVGQRPAQIRSSYRGEVFHIETPGSDIPEVFNRTQEIFETLMAWETRLQKLVNERADIKELVRTSIPILQNRMVVVDYGLRMIAHCSSVEVNGHREIQMIDRYDTIPEEKTAPFQNIYYSTRELRHPFRYNDKEDDCYCINLFAGNSYVGACSLIRDLRNFKESDFALFQILADYIRQAILAQSGPGEGGFITMKTIFSQLLNCLAVSQREAEIALEEYHRKADMKDPVFLCVVLQSSHKGHTLPAEYLCTMLEKMADPSTAVEFENRIVLFCRFPSAEQESGEQALLAQLQPLLKDMNFQAGISEPFSDVFKARAGYLQACCAIDTGRRRAPAERSFRFREYALYYMLEHCCGEFEPQQLMPRGLLALDGQGRNGNYLETLRSYLDNECNASRTASAMYLHRSTLTPKLEKIRSFVDLDTPEQRLYLRLALYLMDLHRSES